MVGARPRSSPPARVPRVRRRPPPRLYLLAVVSLATAWMCVGPIGGAGATVTPSSTNLNYSEDRRYETCAPLKAVPATRYADFSGIGFNAMTSTPTCTAGSQDPNSGCYFAYACVLVDRRDLFDTCLAAPRPCGRIYFHRGGDGGTDDRYGHIWIGDMVDGRAPSPTSARFGNNGSACGASNVSGTTGHYYIRIREMPEAMQYKSGGGASFRKYADTNFKHSPSNVHYGYLTWNWLNANGGGVVRSLIKENQVFHRCDVWSIRMTSVTESGAANGEVVAIYGKTFQGGNWIYGWIMYSHRYNQGWTDPRTGVFYPANTTIYHVANCGC